MVCRKMVWPIMDMEDGGLFGGRALTVWFSRKLRSFTKTTWSCTPTKCHHRFKIMWARKGIVRTNSTISIFPLTVRFLIQLISGLLLLAIRNCEDIAMSLLVANTTGAPPIWVKGMKVTFDLHNLDCCLYDGYVKCLFLNYQERYTRLVHQG